MGRAGEPVTHQGCLACYATLLSAPLCQSVHHIFFLQHYRFFLGMLLLSKCSTDLKYGPAPPDATGVAVYPAFLDVTVTNGPIH